MGISSNFKPKKTGQTGPCLGNGDDFHLKAKKAPIPRNQHAVDLGSSRICCGLAIIYLYLMISVFAHIHAYRTWMRDAIYMYRCIYIYIYISASFDRSSAWSQCLEGSKSVSSWTMAPAAVQAIDLGRDDP